eukprot:m.142325 g.142325  ORF g.142325 m.142325 type:complete len:341 (-) comp14063_c2_seq1:89-1111(-)
MTCKDVLHRRHRLLFTLAGAVYVGTGVGYFTAVKGWTVINSLYFIALVVTTIGYGDHEGDFTQDESTMAFVSIYVLIGFLLIATLFTVAVEKIIQHQERYVAKMRRKLLNAMTGMDSHAEEKLQMAERAEQRALKVQVAGLAILFIVVSLTGCAIMVYQEGNTWLQSVYWLVVTGTTVGFGDISPETDIGKGFAIFYVFILTASFGILVQSVSTLLTHKNTISTLLDVHMTQELVEMLDHDGNGEIQRDEWLKGMLIRLGYVDAEVLTKIMGHFDELPHNDAGNVAIEELLPSARTDPVMLKHIIANKGVKKIELEEVDTENQVLPRRRSPTKKNKIGPR